MKYLVSAGEGPSFTSVEEAVRVLKNIVLPGLDALIDLEAHKTILAGGLPVGERALLFIVEASSHEELDTILQKIPLWSLLTWEVTPLQSFQNRAEFERAFATRAQRP